MNPSILTCLRDKLCRTPSLWLSENRSKTITGPWQRYRSLPTALRDIWRRCQKVKVARGGKKKGQRKNKTVWLKQKTNHCCWPVQQSPSPITAVIVRKNIFLWKRGERSEDANEASYDLGPPQSKGPAALGGGCGEGGLPLLQLVSLQRGVGWESAKHSLECIKLQHKAALLSERTQSSFLLLSTVNIYIYIGVHRL